MAVRYCLGLGNSPLVRHLDPWNTRPIEQEIRKWAPGAKFDLVGISPTLAWTEPGGRSSHLIVQLRFENHSDAQAFKTSLQGQAGQLGQFGFAQDPTIAAFDVWSPTGPGGGIFGDRDLAERITGATELGDATGEGVNVVIADRGLDRNAVEALSLRMLTRRNLHPADRHPQQVPGWTRHEYVTRRLKRSGDLVQMRRAIAPGASGSDHADMVVRNVLAVAPMATIWDAPLLPAQDEEDAPPQLADVSYLFHWILRTVRSKRAWRWDDEENALISVPVDGPWVIVNAWGVLDPESQPGTAGYANDPDHMFTNDVMRLDAANIDIVFAAGNCGEPCPDRRCGAHDTGPGRSIFGLNGHPRVLTVGAVRADGLPVALSAQGPGRLATTQSRETLDKADFERARKKPDLCAPSHFRESDDASETNTGTSASCGFAAGIVAALRSTQEGRAKSPDQLRECLRATATPPDGTRWDPRLGCGVIHAARALAKLRGTATRRAGPGSS
jgi:hypothetical protein